MDDRSGILGTGLGSGGMTLPPFLRAPARRLGRLRRRVLLHRRLLAALCVGAAVLAGLQAAAPPPPATVAVWTAARDLPERQPCCRPVTSPASTTRRRPCRPGW